jgi:acetyl-CoA carboxylase carboxyltransferase component
MKISSFGDGVITGYGDINGAVCAVFGDFTVFMAPYLKHAEKRWKIMDLG